MIRLDFLKNSFNFIEFYLKDVNNKYKTFRLEWNSHHLLIALFTKNQPLKNSELFRTFRLIKVYK